MLTHFKSTYLLPFLLSVVISFNLSGQSLSPGDLAIIGVGVDNEEVLLVALANIPANESVFFTDDEWDGTSFNTGEGFYEWVTPSISAGTVITLTTSSATAGGTVTQRSGSFSLGNSGDGVFLYQTSTNVYNTGTYTLIGFAGEDAGDAGTLAGSGLTLGTNAVYFGGDNGMYTGTRAGQDQAGFLSLIYNSSNWTTSGSAQTFNTSNFTITSGGPAATTGFSASPDGLSSINLSWTLNSGSNDVVVARSTSNSFGTPTDGSTLAVGDALGGAEVVFVGNATQFSDACLDGVEQYFYQIWSVDGSANYSSAQAADATTQSGEGSVGSSGSENASGIPGGTGYIIRTWTGADGSTWTASSAQGFSSAPRVVLNDDVSDAYIESGMITGGVESLTITVARVYSGGSGSVDVLINGISIGTASFADDTPQSTTFNNLNVTGNFTIRINNNIGGSNGGGDQRVGFYSLTWTGAATLEQGESSQAGNWSSTTTWEGGTIPVSTDDVAIKHDVTVDSDYTCDTLVVNSGSTLTISSGNTITVDGILVNNGTIQVEDGASIVQSSVSDNNCGSGTYNITRNTGTLANNTRYRYWSAPVSGATMASVFPNSNSSDFYTFNETTQSWTPGSNMTVGKGYITTGDQNGGTNFTQDIVFDGSVNNGALTLPATVDVSSVGGMLLIGNPYPSAMNPVTFMADNTALNGTIWYWNHSTQQNGSNQNSNTDYATWTGLGSTGGNAAEAPDDYIPSCQGFFVETTSDNPTIAFNNAQRVAGNNTQFFKTANQERRQRIWLNLTNAQGDFNQVLVGFLPEATLGFDRMYDGKKLKAHPSISFYSVLGDEELAIQGLPYIAPNTTERVPLGVDAWITGGLTISIDSLNNWPESYAAWIEDKQEDTLVPVADLPYTFEVDTIGTIKNRFALVVRNEMDGVGGGQELESPEIPSATTGTPETEEQWFNAYAVNGELRMTSSHNLESFTLFDLSGRVVESAEIRSTSYSTTIAGEGLFILQVVRENGELKTQKLKF